MILTCRLVLAAIFAGALASSTRAASSDSEACCCASASSSGSVFTLNHAVTLMGAFAKIGVYELPAGATLVQAIATAGGFSSEADPTRVRLIRTEDGELDVKQINVTRTLEGLARDFELRAQDLIVATEAKSAAQPAAEQSAPAEPAPPASPAAALEMLAATDYPMGDFPQSVSLADLDGDGHLDVMTANRESNSISIRLNAGDGTFLEETTYETDPEPLFVRAHDLDGDGYLDLVVATNANSVNVLPGNGDGSFGDLRRYATGEGERMSLNVQIGDFNRDGRIDLVTANFLDNSISILAGTEDGGFANPSRLPVGDGPISLVTADFNGDEWTDIAIAHRRDPIAQIHMNRGTSADETELQFDTLELPIGSRAGFIAEGDFNNDGHVDLAIPNFGDHSVTLLIGDGEGGFATRELDADICMPSSLGLGDIDGDGWLDIVIVCQSLQAVGVLLNGGEAAFDQPILAFKTGSGPDSVAVGDLNGDGRDDIVTGNLGGNSISVLLSGHTDTGTTLDELLERDETFPDVNVTLIVEFETPENVPVEFEEVTLILYRLFEDNVYHNVTEFTSTESSFEKTFEDMSAGRYLIQAYTDDQRHSYDASRPGAFRKNDTLTLDGRKETVTHRIVYEYFDPATMTGDATVTGRLVNIDGDPVAGHKLTISASHRTAGNLEVGTARTDDDGRFSFAGLAENQTYSIQDESRSVSGTAKAGEEVSLKMAPRSGDAAPNIEFIHLASGETQKLSDFRGKVILIDFWASWCGPCQGPMDKMQSYRDSNPDWGDRVELIALSIDETRRQAEQHLEKNGWNKSYNVWAGDGGFHAEAPRAYGIRGIPTAYLIDADGNVAATGHPSSMDIPRLINDLLAKSSRQ